MLLMAQDPISAQPVALSPFLSLVTGDHFELFRFHGVILALTRLIPLTSLDDH